MYVNGFKIFVGVDKGGRRKTYCDSNACIEYCHSIKY